MTVTQGEKLELCRAHPSNPHWWEAKNENGDVGFVPATYMMVRAIIYCLFWSIHPPVCPLPGQSFI